MRHWNRPGTLPEAGPGTAPGRCRHTRGETRAGYRWHDRCCTGTTRPCPSEDAAVYRNNVRTTSTKQGTRRRRQNSASESGVHRSTTSPHEKQMHASLILGLSSLVGDEDDEEEAGPSVVAERCRHTTCRGKKPQPAKAAGLHSGREAPMRCGHSRKLSARSCSLRREIGEEKKAKNNSTGATDPGPGARCRWTGSTELNTAPSTGAAPAQGRAPRPSKTAQTASPGGLRR